MSISAPQTIYSDLHDRLAVYAFQNGQIDEIGLKRLKVDAEKLMHADAVKAHTILGGIAAVQFKDEELDRHHRAAIRIADESVSHGNYAISLQFAHRREEAADEAVIAADCDPLDKDAAIRAVKFLSIAGRIGEAMARLTVYCKRNSEEPPEELENLPSVARILKRYDIPDEEVRLCQREAFNLLRERRIRSTSVMISTDEGDADESVNFSIFIDAPIETIIQLDEELGNRIFEAHPNLHLERFWLGFDRKHE